MQSSWMRENTTESYLKIHERKHTNESHTPQISLVRANFDVEKHKEADHERRSHTGENHKHAVILDVRENLQGEWVESP